MNTKALLILVCLMSLIFLPATNLIADGITIDSLGRVGIGTTGPTELLHVYGDFLNKDDKLLYLEGYFDATTTANHYNAGLYQIIRPSVAAGITNTGHAIGQYTVITNNDSGSGTLASLSGQSILYGITTGGGLTVTSAKGIYIKNYRKSGTISNSYDLYLDTPGYGGTANNPYTIYAKNPSPNYFAGKVGINTDAPTVALDVIGSVSAAVKAFKIDHPLKPTEKMLIHTAIEAPRNDLIYRGLAKLTNGKATVNIDSASNMSAGTFAALTQNAVVTSLQNQNSFDRLKPGQIKDGVFEIICENVLSEDSVAWVVMAERNDPFIKQSEYSDENGRLIPEVDKKDLVNEDPAKDFSYMLEEKTVPVAAEDLAGVEYEDVKGIGTVKGHYLYPEAYGQQYPTRKVTSVYTPVATK